MYLNKPGLRMYIYRKNRVCYQSFPGQKVVTIPKPENLSKDLKNLHLKMGNHWNCPAMQQRIGARVFLLRRSCVLTDFPSNEVGYSKKVSKGDPVCISRHSYKYGVKTNLNQ